MMIMKATTTTTTTTTTALLFAMFCSNVIATGTDSVRGAASTNMNDGPRIGASPLTFEYDYAEGPTIVDDHGGVASTSMSSRSIIKSKSTPLFTEEDTTLCNVNVKLTCPVVDPIDEAFFHANDCVDAFQTMTFRYTGGDCSQSDNVQERHDFTCVDNDPTNLNAVDPTRISKRIGTPSRTQEIVENEDEVHYIVVTSQSREDTYFSGLVPVGEEYTINSNEEFDLLSAAMTITIYDTEGGNVLQTTSLNNFDCSVNPLFLFDRFGANQVIGWKETSGRVVMAPSPEDFLRTATVGITIENMDPSRIIRLVEMSFLTNMQDEPIDYTPTIQGTTMQPGSTLELPNGGFDFTYNLLQRTRYTFFTTIIAEPSFSLVNGNEKIGGDVEQHCNSHFFCDVTL